jgi:hypothetical protein
MRRQPRIASSTSRNRFVCVLREGGREGVRREDGGKGREEGKMEIGRREGRGGREF